jgi:N-acyl-D-amino-acid deacylase
MSLSLPSRSLVPFLAGIVVVLAGALVGRAAAGQLSTTPNAQLMASFDQEMEAFMAARQIPGGALAVVRDRRLVYARGYGWADRENRIPATSSSLFRIASLTKPITAVAILKLVEHEHLRLDDRPFEILPFSPALPLDQTPDSRLTDITIRHLLNHTAGWDSRKSSDPMFRSTRIADTVGVARPPAPEAVIRYMLGRPLDFDPGSRYAYSNFGYCVLGRVIEKITSATYEDYVKQHVLAPIGIARMRIGASLQSRRADGEVSYYTSGSRTVRSVFPHTAASVPAPYGGFCLEAMDSHGGWIASVADLARFAAALDDPRHSPLLRPETFRIMYARPDPPVWRHRDGTPTDSYYACGWMVRPVEPYGKANYWHTGSIPGSYGLLVRRADGLSWVALFNQRSENPKLPDTAIDPALHRAADKVSEWPSGDLFRNSR